MQQADCRLSCTQLHTQFGHTLHAKLTYHAITIQSFGWAMTLPYLHRPGTLFFRVAVRHLAATAGLQVHAEVLSLMNSSQARTDPCNQILIDCSQCTTAIRRGDNGSGVVSERCTASLPVHHESRTYRCRHRGCKAITSASAADSSTVAHCRLLTASYCAFAPALDPKKHRCIMIALHDVSLARQRQHNVPGELQPVLIAEQSIAL